ncbi:MAG: hypothetical protein ABF532_09585 [Bifidobacterium sp.]|uniref:hypothetical protein n=1 Tax=Bifidobacterium sp. TaxID=41200 RepID=UPI0039E890FD
MRTTITITGGEGENANTLIVVHPMPDTRRREEQTTPPTGTYGPRRNEKLYAARRQAAGHAGQSMERGSTPRNGTLLHTPASDRLVHRHPQPVRRGQGMTSQRKREMVLHWHERDTDDQTIGRLLGMTVPEVQAIIASAEHPASSESAMPLFIQPPMLGEGTV